MRLTLKNFRCHKNLVVEFDCDQIVLIGGDSGAGKSTIFDALFWCLYKKSTGGRSMKVTPWNTNIKSEGRASGTLKTIVILEADDYVIKRTTVPNTLEITIDGELIEGSSAQSYIDDRFGSSDYWLATSYIVQQEKNPLLSGSASVKNELINRLCVDNDDPEAFIEQAKNELKNIQVNHDLLTKSFNQKVLELRNDMETYNITDDDFVKIPDRNKDTLTTLRNDLEKHQGDVVKLTTLQEQRDTIINSIKSEWGEQDLQSKHTSLLKTIDDWNAYRDYLSNQKYYDHLTNRIDALSKIIESIHFVDDVHSVAGPSDEPYTPKEIKMTQEIEQKREHHLKTSERIEVEYEPDILSDMKTDFYERIQEAKKDIKTIESRKVALQRKENLESKIQLNSKKVDTTLREKITSVEKQTTQLQTLHASRIEEIKELTKNETMKCPHCQGGVFYCNGGLQKTFFVEKAPLLLELASLEKDRSKRLLDAKNELKVLQKKNDECKAAEGVVRDARVELERLQIPDDIQNADIPYLSDLESIYHTLRSIEWIKEPEVSSEQMIKRNDGIKCRDATVEYNKLIEDLQQINVAKVAKPTLSKEEATKKIKSLERAIQRQSELASYPSDLDEKVKRSEKSVKDLKKAIQDENDYLEKARLIELCIQKRDALLDMREEVEKVWKEMEVQARLVDYMIESEHSVYQYACDTINDNLHQITRNLFKTPIHVEVRTVKIVTSTKREKPSINLYVLYNGIEVNVNDFSVGERERLSLALTLALMKLSKSPVVILDETFAALNEENRESAIGVLREHGKRDDLVTLCVNHDSTTGWYDLRYHLDSGKLLRVDT